MEVVGYNNYLIYDDGRVWSKYNNKFLKPFKNTDGYYMVDLFNDGKGKKFKVHRLVALHYIPLVEGKDQVDHINNIKTDNRLENLHWVNHSENMINTPVQNNNKLGHKNIRLTKWDTYNVQIRRNKKMVYNQSFKTLQEAIKYRDEYLETGVATKNNGNNNSGNKNIYLTKCDTYRFNINRLGVSHSKSFKTLDEAIKYRDEYLECS